MIVSSKRPCLLDDALRLNARGRRVFPVEFLPSGTGSVQKKPAILSYHGPRPFPEWQIRRWPWVRAEALGWALPPDVVLLDVDVKGGKLGQRHLAQLQTEHGPLPPTAQQETSSGGQHLLFRLPQAAGRFHGRVPLSDAPKGKADIDICHTGHRFMTIYDESIFDQRIATLPKLWQQLLTKDKTEQRISSATQLRAQPAEDIGDLWGRLGTAEEGDRNNALNDAVFLLARDGEWDGHHHSRATELARGSGLDDGQITATITSALAGGRRQRKKPEGWYNALIADDRLAGRRSRQALWQTGAEFRELAVLHGMRVGLSVRDLAERLGTSHESAARYIRVLRKLGYLARDSARDKHEAVRYKLLTPDYCAKGDSPPVSGVGKQPTGGLSPFVRPTAPWLYRHDAFIRSAGSVWLPKSCAAVLAEVEGHPPTVNELVLRTGLSAATVRRAAHILESAGLVTYDSRGTRRIEASFTDLEQALNKWAAFSEAKGNHERLKAGHRLDRVERDKPRVRSPRLPGGGSER